MSDMKAGAITLGGIGVMLAISFGAIPGALTLGCGALAIGGVIGIALGKSKK